MKQSRQRLSPVLSEERDRLVFEEWRSRIFKLTEIALMFRMTTGQAFTIIKNENEKLQEKVLEKWREEKNKN